MWFHSVEVLNVSLYSCYFIFSLVMFWSNEHDVLLCQEVVNLNPFTSKKGSTQRSGMWEKIATILNQCTELRFRVDKWSVRDHMGILVSKHKRKVRAEEKASGIVPDEPSELENLLDTYRFGRKCRCWITGIKSREKWKMWKRPSKGRRCKIKGYGKAVWD